MKRKLLIATDSFLPRWDGVARFLSEIIPRLTGEYDITVVAPAFVGTRVKFPGITLIRIPLQKVTIGDYTPSVIDLRKIKKLVASSDVVFSQSIGPIGAPAIYYASKQKKKVISYMHSIEWELVSKSVKRYKEFAYTVTKKVATYLYNKCDVILVPSSEIRHVLVREKIRPPKKIVHVGTDSDSFVPGNRGEAKKKLKFRRKDIVIGYVGRIAREKDLGTLERAFVILRKKYRDIQLLVVGEGIPEEVERLRKSGVTLVGGQDNVVPYYQAMDMFVLSSLTETSSIATMEAMSCGKAVVVTPVGFLRSYVKEGINGLFFGRGNVRKLVEQLEKLIGDPGLREQLGLRARATIIERFPWENTVSDIKKVLG